jgi:hypothetical protein
MFGFIFRPPIMRSDVEAKRPPPNSYYAVPYILYGKCYRLGRIQNISTLLVLSQWTVP